MFPLATLAQLGKALRTRSAADLSYAWMFVYVVAEVLYSVYSFHFKLWPIFGPCVFELGLMAMLFVTKFSLEYLPLKGRSRERNESRRQEVAMPKVQMPVGSAADGVHSQGLPDVKASGPGRPAPTSRRHNLS
eukprot:SM000293S10912  [mRNA]  locus=s293:37813:38598:+ [translate_table: standard]